MRHFWLHHVNRTELPPTTQRLNHVCAELKKTLMCAVRLDSLFGHMSVFYLWTFNNAWTKRTPRELVKRKQSRNEYIQRLKLTRLGGTSIIRRLEQELAYIIQRLKLRLHSRVGGVTPKSYQDGIAKAIDTFDQPINKESIYLLWTYRYGLFWMSISHVHIR